MSARRAMIRLAALAAMALAAFPCVADGGSLPRMVDLGAGKCIPCKKMAPIIEEMKKDYAGVVDIVFIDVWKDPKAGKPYKLRMIPTQVFFDAGGKEVFRHEGFFSREDIEKVFVEKMGVKPVPPAQKKSEGQSSNLLPQGLMDGDSDDAGAETPILVGELPSGLPLHVHVVYASFACACVMERCERYGRLLREIMNPRGGAVVQVWTDRMENPEKADSLMAAWGLGYLPGIALLDPLGHPFYADDEEIDLDTFAAWLEEAL